MAIEMYRLIVTRRYEDNLWVPACRWTTIPQAIYNKADAIPKGMVYKARTEELQMRMKTKDELAQEIVMLKDKLKLYGTAQHLIKKEKACSARDWYKDKVAKYIVELQREYAVNRMILHEAIQMEYLLKHRGGDTNEAI